MNKIYLYKQISLRQAYALTVGGNYHFAAAMLRGKKFEKEFKSNTKTQKLRAYIRGCMDSLGLTII